MRKWLRALGRRSWRGAQAMVWLLLGALAASAVAGYFVVPEWQLGSPTGLTEAERLKLLDDYHKTYVQAVGGLVLTLGVVFTYLNSRANIRSSRASEQKNVIDSDRALTERYTKAVEQLGSEKLEVRLGAIYALERIAYDSPQDHWPIMETLTAYIRERSPAPVRSAGQETVDAVEQPMPPLTPIDVVAAFTVICRRKYERDQERELDLRQICLNFADDRPQAWYKVHLENADLRWAWLGNTEFRDGHFEDALFADATLVKVTFIESNLGGILSPRAHWRGVKFLFSVALLKGAHLADAHLEGTDFKRAHLEGADFGSAHLEGTDFERAHLEGADFTGALGLTQAQLARAFTDEKTILPEHLTTTEQPAQTTDVTSETDG
jgi:uncharacterized protein YjbI with pentapeptide repeats